MHAEQVFRVVILAVLAIQVSSNDIKTVYTNGPGYSQYFSLRENLVGGNTLRFSVRTPKDAYILLSTSHQAEKPVYEIVLGARDNTVNYIRGRYDWLDEPSATTRTVNLLSHLEFRNFWIRLRTDARNTSVIIQVGIGEEKTPFMEWRDTNPLQPQYLSFRSDNWAHWKYGYSDEGNTVGLSKDKRQSVVTMTKNGPTYGQYYPLSELVSHSDDLAVVFYFTVQTPKELRILLSPIAAASGDRYEFGLRQKDMYINRQRNGTVKQPETKTYTEDGLINADNKLKYWIKLDKDGQVMMGKGGSVEPVLFWNDPNPVSPQFVSFNLIQPEGEAFDPTIHADVQYGLGPDYTLESQDCKPRWRESVNQQLPPGAVRGGYNARAELFICRASEAGSVLPGGIMPKNDNTGVCEMPYGTVAHKKTTFEVLTGCNFRWIPESFGRIPAGDTITSQTSSNIYVVRVNYESQVILGKLVTGQGVAFIAYNDEEIPFQDYDMLAVA